MSRLTNARDELERYEQTKPADYQSKYQRLANAASSGGCKRDDRLAGHIPSSFLQISNTLSDSAMR